MSGQFEASWGGGGGGGATNGSLRSSVVLLWLLQQSVLNERVQLRSLTMLHSSCGTPLG